jgi:hypothetical protein
MSTKASAAALVQAYKDLAAAWQATKAQWRDVKTIEFEQTYLEELPNRVNRTLSVMSEIDALLSKIRKDCE